MAHSHDLEFHVAPEGSFDTKIFHNFDKAAGHALALACSGRTALIDVVTFTKAAARRWGGDAAVDVYEEDPEASVHDRIVVKAESLGRVP
jgi:hypothetical protein